MTNAQRLDKMLDSIGFYGRIEGDDKKLSGDLKGLEISRAGNRIYVGHGYGSYGTRLTQRYFPTPQAVVDYLKARRVNLDMLKTGIDPCIFNGL